MRRVLGADAERRVLKADTMKCVLSADAVRRVLNADTIRCVLIHEASAEGRRREARAHVQTP